MAVKIRLKRLGKIRTPHYRIVIMDARQKRDGRAIEEVGLYSPKSDPSVIRVNSERVQYWLGVGAQPTEAVIALLKRSGDWQAYSGDTSESGILEQKAKADKLARYNAAVADEPVAGDAVKPKRATKKEQAAEAVQDAIDEAVEKKTSKASQVADKVEDKVEAVAEEKPAAEVAEEIPAAEEVVVAVEKAVAPAEETVSEAVESES